MAKKIKSDLDEIGNDISDMFDSLGDSFNSIVDGDKKAIDAIDGIVNFGVSTVKASWGIGEFALKNTAKAVVAVAEVKREFIEKVEEKINEVEKKKLDDDFEAKIKKLVNKNGK